MFWLDGEFNIVHSIASSNCNTSSLFIFQMTDEIAVGFAYPPGFRRWVKAIQD